ncbi:MAG TPA: NADH-quinone oxidoreductase subunit H [bacterium]|jgi:NADH-quinone oxidoreductase subunit H|nr:NADH-quinone oxidoreductase subunit H [bacterium]
MNSGLGLIVWIIAYPFVSFSLGVLLGGYGRKLTARIQRRVGPSWIQPFYDVVKLMSKKTNVSHGYMHDVAMMMLVGGTLLTMYFVPVPGFHYFSQFGDYIVIMYIMLVPPLGMALGVGQTANPNGSIGIARALQMLAGYEVTFVLTFIGFAMKAGTTSMYDLMMLQQSGGVATWGIVTNPLLGIAALFALQGMMNEKPFEVIVAPHEIATGPMTEMGGKYLGMMFIQHLINLVVELTIYMNLFLGGALNWFEYIVKLFTLFTLVLVVNAVYGRFRTDSALRFFWKLPLPMAALGVIFIMWNGK